MKRLVRQLKRLGFTDGEARVYLALLHGCSTKSSIVKFSGISPSIVYEVLEKLVSRGFASFAWVDGRKYYKAAAPEKLLEEIKNLETIGKRVVEELRKIRAEESVVFANIYKGIEGLKALLKDVEKEFRTNGVGKWLAVNVTTYKKESFNRVWSKWHNFVRPRYNVKAKFIFSSKEGWYFRALKNAPLAEVRYIPSTSSTCLTVTGDMVIVMKYTDPSSFVLIKNESIAQTFEWVFNVLWSVAQVV